MPTNKKLKGANIKQLMIIILVVVGICLYFFWLKEAARQWSLLKGQIVSSDSKKVKAQYGLTIASTEGERMKGYMFIRSLNSNEGKIFVFPHEDKRSFWMKDVYIPLDMIFLNSELKVVDIIHNAKVMDTTPLPSDKNSMYVIEINGGKAKEAGIEIGDILQVKGSLPKGLP